MIACQPFIPETTISPSLAVQFWSPSAQLTQPITTTETQPQKLLILAGFNPADIGELWWNGAPLSLESPLQPGKYYLLQVIPRRQIAIMENNTISEFQSTATTLLDALWENGYRIRRSDSLSIDPNALLGDSQRVVLQRSVPVTIMTDGNKIQTYTSAATVGKALAQIGLPLQNLDFSTPAEDQPIPVSGIIKLTKVKESIFLEQIAIPQGTEYRPDPNTPRGQEWIIEAGWDGAQINKTTIRYENDQEVSRQLIENWSKVDPQPKIIGYGTKVIIEKVPGTDLDYWAAVEMYATSYYPCGFASGICSYSTASGKPLTKGIVAVTLEWYRVLKGTRVYIPGYGFGEIADTGGGIPGKVWIDLGYDNENYVPWSGYVTVYFLPPAPETIPWFLR